MSGGIKAMGWFEREINIRKEKDDEAFGDAFGALAGAVMGRKVRQALYDDRRAAKSAMDEVLRFYHVRAREIPDGMTDMEEQLEYLLRPAGIMRRTVTLSEGWRKDAIGAMLGTWKEDGSLAALVPDKLGRYRFWDKRRGKQAAVGKKEEALFDREALCFYRPLPLKKIGLPSLLRFMVQGITAADIVCFLLAAGAAALLGMLMPKLNGIVFSQVVVQGTLTTVLAMTVFLVSVSVSSLLMNGVKTLLLARVQTKMEVSVQAASMMRLLSLPASFFKGYSAGDLASRAGQVQGLCNMLLTTLFGTGITALFSLVYVFQIFAYAPSLVGPAVTIVGTTFLFSVLSAHVQMRVSKMRLQLEAKENGMGYALICGIQKIRLSGAEKRAFARWARLYAEEAGCQYDPPLFLKQNSVIVLAITLAGTIWLQVEAVKSHLPVADYYAFNTAYGMVSGAFAALASASLCIASIKPVMELVQPIFSAEPEVSGDKEVVAEVSGDVELNNISFRYGENMPWVLEDLSLHILPGQYVAIVGATGCGKSTMLRLLLGFESPQKGAVYYDGKDLRTLDLKSLRGKIGVVLQNGRLFQGDIYSNIVISAPQLSVDEAWKAAEMAGIAQDIRDMPMGMHTIISEGSGGVSGGQRQRLMIARAIAPKPKILMFDEATSALDNLTQKQVSDSLETLQCTRIVIAHRLSTIRNCDRILVLDRGKIIEDGTYGELMERKGYFAELVERQQV